MHSVTSVYPLLTMTELQGVKTL